MSCPASGKQAWVAVGELAVSSDPEMELITSTASCMAIVAYCQSPRLGVMAHLAMPDSRNMQRLTSRPAFYADHAVAALQDALAEHHIDPKSVRIHLVGGASVAEARAGGDLGGRNLQAVQQQLATVGLTVTGQDVLGTAGLRVRLRISDGDLEISQSPGLDNMLSQKANGWNPPGEMVQAVSERLGLIAPTAQASAQVLNLLGKDPVDWKTTLQWIAADTLLSLHVVRQCNAVTHGQARQVETIWQGQAELPAETFTAICTRAAGQGGRRIAPEQLGLSHNSLSAHARKTASLAREMVRKQRPELEGPAIFAALTHPVRMLCWSVVQKLQGHRGVGDYRSGPDAVQDAHCRLWGQLAAAVLAEWNLPARMIPAMAGPGAETDRSDADTRRLQQIVVAACTAADSQPCCGFRPASLPGVR